MFREIRRKDRILDNELAIRLLEEAEYGFLAMSGINGYGYGIPINYVKEGYKLECLRENPKVSFTVVGATQIVPGKFTTGYESTIAFGEMHLDLPEEERRYALRLLVNKYSSAFKEIGEKYIEKSFYRTNILRLDISHISGKCKRLSQ